MTYTVHRRAAAESSRSTVQHPPGARMDAPTLEILDFLGTCLR